MCPAAQTWRGFKSPSLRHIGRIPTLLGNTTKLYLLPLGVICRLLVADRSFCCIHFLHVVHGVDDQLIDGSEFLSFDNLNLTRNIKMSSQPGVLAQRVSACTAVPPFAFHSFILCPDCFFFCFFTVARIRLNIDCFTLLLSHLPLRGPQLAS